SPRDCCRDRRTPGPARPSAPHRASSLQSRRRDTIDDPSALASSPLRERRGGYSKLPWYALRENYCAAVVRAGGLPILLPHEPDQVAPYLALLDGIVITGGAFDVDPALFGATVRHEKVTTKDRRTQFELAITRGALAADKPVLGICGG